MYDVHLDQERYISCASGCCTYFQGYTPTSCTVSVLVTLNILHLLFTLLSVSLPERKFWMDNSRGSPLPQINSDSLTATSYVTIFTEP